MNKYDLNGRIAVVTGGFGGIGLAIRERLIASGACVSLWDLKAPPDRSSAQSDCLVDITDEDAVDEAVANVHRHFGRIDILINSAGIIGPNVELCRTVPDEWRRTIDVNLNGAFLTCRAVAPTMLRTGYGRIVNIASIAGKEGNPLNSAYSAAKAGVIALTKSLGKELAGSGVLVNCITPATIDTAILSQISDEFRAFVTAKIPLGRLGHADEVAAMTTWLASEDCSFSTGAIFDLSGGRATY